MLLWVWFLKTHLYNRNYIEVEEFDAVHVQQCIAGQALDVFFLFGFFSLKQQVTTVMPLFFFFHIGNTDIIYFIRARCNLLG